MKEIEIVLCKTGVSTGKNKERKEKRKKNLKHDIN
jgi:hypothetical protein